MLTSTSEYQRYIPYSSWDNHQFWIGREVYGRDFPTWQEADDYGAIFLNTEQFAIAKTRYQEVGALTYNQVVN